MKLKAYTDGSYEHSRRTFALGLVLLNENDEVVKEFGSASNAEGYVDMRNVGGEIMAAMMAVRFALEMEAEELTIYHDYNGVGFWPDGKWRAKNPLTASYRDMINGTRGKMKIEFIHVKGHSGNRWNDRADELAKEALRNGVIW